MPHRKVKRFNYNKLKAKNISGVFEGMYLYSKKM